MNFDKLLWQNSATFSKKMHQQVLLDAKRKVMKCQVSNTTHLAMGRDQKLSGHNLPPPSRSDRVKPLDNLEDLYIIRKR